MASEATKRRLPAPQRRALIEAAALEEFARRGYDDASMTSIATASGVTRAVLYDHFDSKRALFAALLESQSAKLLAHLGRAITADAPVRERMLDTLRTMFTYAQEEPLGWRLLFPDREPVDPEAARDHGRAWVAALRVLAGLLGADAIRAGLDPAGVQAQAAFAQWQGAVLAAVRWWQAHPEVSREALLDSTMTVLWTGIGGLTEGRV